MSTVSAGQRLGPYEVASLIGAGGMGEVYQARDTRLNRTVAIKVSREQFSERFEREARAIAALNHPNICTLYDVGPNYLVMELVEGPTLADRIADGAIPLEEALRIARQIGDALEAAHEQGIVHRDLKPGNVKVKPDGLVKVLDFGLAKVGGAPAAQDSQNSPTISMAATQAGVILGTAAYMAPEQARGKPVDKRADIWSFGVVLYEMLTGRRLFEGEDVTETLASVIKAEPAWDGIPSNVQRLLKSCLEKDPKRRLRDIGDAWRLLESAPGAPAPARSRFGMIAVTSVAAVATVVASALAFFHFREKPLSTEVVRFPIAPLPGGSFTGTPYVSPDGRRVAVRMRTADGRSQMWGRFLDSLELRPLSGMEGITTFWSPDSRFIAFAVQGKLRKVDTSSGSAQTVCDIPAAGQMRGGAWNRGGVILFGAADTGLWRVAQEGGAPSAVTTLDPSRKEIFHSGPDFLPDGRHFIYQRVARGEDTGIYIGSLDAKPEQQSSKRLLPGEGAALFAPASDPGSKIGHILFPREGSLMAQAFDLRRLELTGEAVPVVEGIPSGGPRAFSVSTTGVLAYRTGGLSGAITQLTWFDRAGKDLGTVGDPGGYSTMALSRDGTRVAVSRTDPQGSRLTGRLPSDILVHEFARSMSTHLTRHPASDWFAAWSPEGNRIIFSSERDGGVYNLYEKVASGAGNDEPLVRSNEDKSVQDWSRDGRFLLYSVAVGGRSERTTTSHDLWFLPLTAGNAGDGKAEPYLKTEFNENQGQFSPDGHFIAYMSDASGRDEIYVQPFPTASGDKVKISTAGGVAPRWRADGKGLFYISADFKMMAVDVSSTNRTFKAGTPKELFRAQISGDANTRLMICYDVTADGKKFLMNSQPAATAASPEPITMVLNWTALLKK